MEIEEKFVWLLWDNYSLEIPPTLFAVYSTYEAALESLKLNREAFTCPHIEQEKVI